MSINRIMVRKGTYTWIRVAASLFLTVFLVYYAIISAYAHVHVVNGVMVVHSHPFSDQHTHTAGQTLVLHYLTDFHSLEASAPQFVESPFQPVFLIDYSEHVPTCLLPEFYSGLGLRAPPFSSFLFA